MRRLAVAILALAAATPLAAQGGGSSITGRITTADGRPVPGARIVKSGTTDTARADSTGRYHLDRIPLGSHVFVVRQAGYQPVEMEVTFSKDTSLTVDVPLEGAAAANADKLTRVGFLARQRAANGQGGVTFMGPDDIAQRNVPRTSQLFDHVTDVTMRSDGSVMVAYGWDRQCVMNVWLDGTRQTQVFGGTSAGGSRSTAGALRGSATGLDDLIQVGDIAGIEVYPRPTRVPPQFQVSSTTQSTGRTFETRTSDCGAIVIWSNRGM